jgi:hypothetical protein
MLAARAFAIRVVRESVDVQIEIESGICGPVLLIGFRAKRAVPVQSQGKRESGQQRKSGIFHVPLPVAPARLAGGI